MKLLKFFSRCFTGTMKIRITPSKGPRPCAVRSKPYYREEVPRSKVAEPDSKKTQYIESESEDELDYIPLGRSVPVSTEPNFGEEEDDDIAPEEEEVAEKEEDQMEDPFEPEKEQERVVEEERLDVARMKLIPNKLGNMGSFTLPCEIGYNPFLLAVLDSGSSINLMPYTVYRNLGITKPMGPKQSTLYMANGSAAYPMGIVTDIMVKVGNASYPCDFEIFDMDPSEHEPILLGRPFLRTAGAVMNFKEDKVTIDYFDRQLTFAMPRAGDREAVRALQKKGWVGKSFQRQKPNAPEYRPYPRSNPRRDRYIPPWMRGTNYSNHSNYSNYNHVPNNYRNVRNSYYHNPRSISNNWHHNTRANREEQYSATLFRYGLKYE